MQQTEKYQLNLIETTDTFSPAPLNENAQKLETALTQGLAAVRAEAAAGDAAEANARASAVSTEANARAAGDTAEAQARAAGDAALEQRIITLEGKHAVAGTFTGNGAANSVYQFIDLGFTPTVVLSSLGASRNAVMAWAGNPWSINGSPGLIIAEGGFNVCNTTNMDLNTKNRQYCFIAIG